MIIPTPGESRMKHSWVSPRGCSVRELPNSSVVVVPNTGPRDLPTWDGRPDSRGQRTTAPGNSGPTMPSECESAARGQKKRAALVGRSLFTTLNNLCSENSGAQSDETPIAPRFRNSLPNWRDQATCGAGPSPRSPGSIETSNSLPQGNLTVKGCGGSSGNSSAQSSSAN